MFLCITVYVKLRIVDLVRDCVDSNFSRQVQSMSMVQSPSLVVMGLLMQYEFIAL